MIHNFLIGGIILSPLVPELAISILLTAFLSVLLMRLGFYQFVWHRPLVELSIFCIILGCIVAFTPDGWPVLGTTMR
jgi:hypothetical protein